MTDDISRAQYQQLDSLQALEAGGEAVGGWKLGLTSGESRDAFGPGIRPFGFILASRILASNQALIWSEVGLGGIENEVCFLIGEDVQTSTDCSSIRPYLAGVAPAFEINQRRIARDAAPAERVADDLSNWGIVVGEMIPIPKDWQPAALTVTLLQGDEPMASVAAAGHIDDHFESLATLANRLLDYDRQLKKGDRVITGAFGKQAQPAFGEWVGDFGPELGRVALNIVA
jgi:2-oxo-hept-3-ene-1,7-dioate hydratase